MGLLNSKDKKNVIVNDKLNKFISNDSLRDDLKDVFHIRPSNEDLTKLMMKMVVKRRDLPENEQQIIYASTKKFNKKWKKGDIRGYKLYIDENLCKQPWQNTQDHCKYWNSRRDLFNGNIITPTYADYDEDSKKISIVDGRNRFSNLRDLGAQFVPLLIDSEQYKYFRSMEVSRKDFERLY